MPKLQIKFNAPPHHKLIVEDGGREIEIPGQGTEKLSEELATELVTAPYVDCELVEGELPEEPEPQEPELSERDSRHDLNQAALAVGVESPEELPSKRAVLDATKKAKAA